jgi:enoyl-CoA hydratase/carnithine racemase
MGLVQRVTEDPRSVAEEVAANDPGSLRVLKELIRAGGDREDGEAREREAFVELLASRAGDFSDQ